MATLTITSKGQVTLNKEVLNHLGLVPGDKIEVALVPGRKAEFQAVRPKKSWAEIKGILAGKTTKVATLKEIEEAAQRGWAGLVRFDDDEDHT